MICNNCGLENNDRSNFCAKCGAKLPGDCDCWVLGEKFDCGLAECPGIGLYLMLLKAYGYEEKEGDQEHERKANRSDA